MTVSPFEVDEEQTRLQKEWARGKRAIATSFSQSCSIWVSDLLACLSFVGSRQNEDRRCYDRHEMDLDGSFRRVV